MDFEQLSSVRKVFLESNLLLTERHLNNSAKWSSEALNGMIQLTREQQYAEFQMMKRSNNFKSSNAPNSLSSPLLSSASFEPSATASYAIGSTGFESTSTNANSSTHNFTATNKVLGSTTTGQGSTNSLNFLPSAFTGGSLTGELEAQQDYNNLSGVKNENEEFNQFIERDVISLADSYFNCKEYNRCSDVLKNCKSYRALFLRLYSLFLSGEKKRSLENGTVLGQNDRNSQNPNLTTIIKELEEYKTSNNISSLNDPFLLYLQGIIFLKSKKMSHAQEMFYQSLSLYPINWSCWKELIASLSTFSEALRMINRIRKNTKFTDRKEYYLMFLFFKITVYQEFYQISNEVLSNLNDLCEIFPNFSFLKTQKALISYNELDYATAENLFDDILKSDPMRLDEMDIYSNILYVMENRSKLSYLAHYAHEVDPLRPETCCIIANYHSIKFDHQKAIMYYKRALSLSQDCLSAWTLMGHEFVELKNSNAAIESYRRAVDTNNKDFRAWYGLGQAYEVLDMHLYSLYYYQRACSLKPMDKRMWQAIGNCCEKLEDYEDSIKSYKKALSVSIDSDPAILCKLGHLYSHIDDAKNAKLYMKICLDQELNGEITDETTKARLWLAQHEMLNSNWQLAYNYAVDLTQGTSQEIEEARAIAREARMKLNTSTSSKKAFL